MDIVKRVLILFDNHYYIKIRLKMTQETKSKSKTTREPVR